MEHSFDFSSYNNIKRMSEAELNDLWNKYISDRSNKKLRDTLILQYIYLVRYVTGRIKGFLPVTISIEDVASYGIEGLIDAVERYVPHLTNRFETYALIRIRGNVLDKIRSQDFIPRSARQRIKEIKQANDYLRQELGRNPTTSELSRYLNIDAEQISKILSEDVVITSIYEKKNSYDDSLEVIDTIEDNGQSPHERAENENIKSNLEKALQRLPEKERVTLYLYYQKDMTMKEIGQIIGTSESRVCQLHTQGLVKLKKILNENRSIRLQKAII